MAFSQELLHRTLKINASGFFDLDFSLLSSVSNFDFHQQKIKSLFLFLFQMISSISMYIIILVQFRFNEHEQSPVMSLLYHTIF